MKSPGKSSPRCLHHRTGAAQVHLGKEMSSPRSRAGGNPCSANTVWPRAIAPSPTRERIKPYSITLAHRRMRRSQELGSTCKVWGPGVRRALQHLSAPRCWGRLRAAEQPPQSSVRCCGGVPADAVLIYSQAANVNQIFLCSVINVNHKTRKVLRSQ